MQNIIKNGLKYGLGEAVEISVSSEERCRLISVKSKGNIPPENDMAHIFDSFFRGSNTTGREGSGLGLYIARKLMQNMDGDIYAAADGDYMTVTAVFRET